MELIDSHLHIGNLSDTEIVIPEQIKKQLNIWGVTGGMVMPVAKRGGGDDWETHKQLYLSAYKIGFDIALYVNRKMLKQCSDLSNFLLLPFSALKIHPSAVDFSDQDLCRVCEIAVLLKLPLMIHTGFEDCCRASRFEPFIIQYPEVNFVLCHARPSDEAFPLLMRYTNVWIDTAFLPFSNLQLCLSSETENRILFGTDFPVNRWFPHLGDETEWYQQQITFISKTFSSKVIRKIFSENYNNLYNNNLKY